LSRIKLQNKIQEGSGIPLYRLVEDMLRDQIAAGHYKEGDLLPSEKELALIFGVSQGTVRKAVLDLTQHGILYRKQGRGTFVVFQKDNRRRLRNFRFVESLDSELTHLNLGFIGIKVISADTQLADIFNVKPSTRLICLERMGTLGDEDNILQTVSYLPKHLYPGMENFTAEDFAKNTLWKFQEIHFKIRMDRREEFVSAVLADSKLARLLEVPEGAAILRIQVKAYSTGNEIVEYRVSHCNSNGLNFFITHRLI
jgi:GntR family transcriptional regulator